jgi:hypothetical protein
MLDAVIEVTGAEKGLILLNDDAFSHGGPRGGARDGPRRRDARTSALGPHSARPRLPQREARGAITDTSGAISDSIVRRCSRRGVRSS